MSIRFVKNILPDYLKIRIKATKVKNLKKKVQSLPQFSESQFSGILTDRLGLKGNDVVFVHSSIDHLNLGFPFYRIIGLLREITGEGGTVLFPTYHNITSYEYLKKGNIFDVRKTPTFTGILNEFARRQRDSVRSLHPIKSVVAIGKYAHELTNEHHLSPYPYDINSPYFKLKNFNAKIIGLGVMTTYLSAVHAVDDFLKEKFPVKPYHNELFQAKCIDYSGNEVIVPTYAHNMNKMNFSLPDYFNKNIDKSICEDIEINGQKFFRSDASLLLDKMISLAQKGITIYNF